VPKVEPSAASCAHNSSKPLCCDPSHGLISCQLIDAALVMMEQIPGDYRATVGADNDFPVISAGSPAPANGPVLLTFDFTRRILTRSGYLPIGAPDS
jgi:hypothetical protein